MEGSFTALATPFKNGRIDEDAYRAFAQWQLEEGISGLVPMGTTGEAATCTLEERLLCVRLAVEVARGRAKVIAGASSNSTRETIEAVGKVRDAGADAALVVTPYYNKPTQAGLVAHFRAIAQAHPDFPLVAYNVPGRTGVDLLPSTYPALSEIREVAAVKEATGSMPRVFDIFESTGKQIALLSGHDFTVAPFLASGGRGVISVSSNVVPRWMAELVSAGLAGDVAQARALQLKLNRLHRLLFVESNPIPVKWALHWMGKFGPELRLPLLPMTPENAAHLEASLRELGIPGGVS